MKKLTAVSVGVSFCTAKREAAAVVSGEPPDDIAGGEVRSAGRLDLRRPKCEKVRKPWVLRLKRWSLSMRVSDEEGKSGKDCS